MTGLLKYGKTPYRAGAVSFKAPSYLESKKLPAAPLVFGHYSLVKQPWGMLGNATYGDCAWAGPAHETMLLNAEADKTVAFDTASVLSDYSAVTGFNPDDPSTDRGSNVADVAAYRRKVGVLDASGRRHKIAAYLELGNVDLIAQTAHLFGVAGIGIQVPETAQEQFQNHEPWSVVRGAQIEGGHYVPVVGRVSSGNFLVVTWGALQLVTPEFLDTYVDEAYAYLSTEDLIKGKTLEGFDVDQLEADLNAL
jgi:hypothetical protein